MARQPLTEESLNVLRERIGAVALELFREGGLSAVSLRTIGPHVTLTPMALYRYFPGGQGEIVSHVRAAGFDDLARVLERGAASAGDPLDRITAMLIAVVRFAVAHASLYKLMFDFSQPEFEKLNQRLGDARRRAWAPAERVFAETVDAGLLTGDAVLLPHLFFAGVHGVIHFELSRQPYSKRSLAALLRPMIHSLFLAHGVSPERVARLKLDRIPHLRSPS